MAFGYCLGGGMNNISPSKSLFYKSKESIGYFTKRGDIYLICPFHKEKTPSCVIHAKTSDYFICYGCGKCGKSKWVYKIIGENPPSYVRSEQFELDNPAFCFYYDVNLRRETSPDLVSSLPF